MINSIFEFLNKFLLLFELIPILLGIWIYFSHTISSRIFLGLSKDKDIDIIVTTSDSKRDVIGASAVRSTTGIGQILGISSASRLIGRIYRKKSVIIQMSESLLHRPDKDLILFGGPAKNKITKKFLENFYEKNPTLRFKFDDVNVLIELKRTKISRPNLDIDNDGKVDRDYSIVICAQNPFSVDDRRVILCAGFTSFGTAGAATWLFEDTLLKGYSGIKKIKKLKNIRKPSFIAIIKVGVSSGQVIETECIDLVEFD